MTDTLGNLIAGAKSEVAGRLDGTIQPEERCARCQNVAIWDTAIGVVPHAEMFGHEFQPREVEYEWRVLTDGASSPLTGEAWAREVLDTWRRGGEDAWLERRPVGEWERVDE